MYQELEGVFEFSFSYSLQGRTNGGGNPKPFNKWVWFQKMSFFTGYITLMSSNESETIIIAHFKQVSSMLFPIMVIISAKIWF